MKTLTTPRGIFFAVLGFLQTGAIGAFLVTSGFAPVPVAFAASFPALNQADGQTASHNWAGYVAENGTYTSISGSWVVPSVPATGSLAADATWIGIGGVKSKDLIQTGTQAITNSRGQIAYSAWYELLPEDSVQVSSLVVNPGDAITASIGQIGQGQWVISLTNTTTGKGFSKTVSYNSSLSSAEWIQEMPTGVDRFIPLDNFGSVNFTGATAIENGVSVSASQAGAQPMVLIDNSRTVLAQASVLGNDGQGFTVTRSTAVSAAPAAVAVRTSSSTSTHTHRVVNFTTRKGSH